MASQRTTEKVIGFLYLTFMASSIAGFSMLESYLSAPDYLRTFYENRSGVSLAVILHLINDASVVAIGILMFNLFRKASDPIATTILTTRVMEATILIIGKLAVMVLLTISKEYVNTGGTEVYYMTLATLARKWNAWSFEMAMLALGVGGFMLNYFLLSRKLMPVSLALLGMIGYMTLFSKSVLTIVGISSPFYLFLPVAIFEITFPFWLIFKGLKPLDG